MMKMELRGDEISSVKVAKQWYKTCMDTGSDLIKLLIYKQLATTR